MVQAIAAYEALDGRIYRTSAEAERADDSHRARLKEQAVQNAVEEIQYKLREEHPTQPWRKGGDGWRSYMADLVLTNWPYLKVVHEHYDELAAVMDAEPK